MFSKAGALPKHLYINVDSSFVRTDKEGFERAVWFGLVSQHGRAWGCNLLLEDGAIYRNVPPHAIAFSDDATPRESWHVDDAQTWDCYGERFSTIEYPYLSGMDVSFRTKSGLSGLGQYLFTAVPIGDGFSNEPEQDKEFFFIRTYGDRLTIQPTNFVLFHDKSFTEVKEDWPTNIKRQRVVWSCE